MKSSHRNYARTAVCAAALAACGWAQAQSSVTIYGIVSQDLVHVTNTGTAKVYLNDGKLNASRIGFKGVEDLGGGLAAIFDIESGISPDTGSANGGNTFWNRGSYVGLKSNDIGTLTFGRQWNVNDDLLGNFFIFGGYAVFAYGGLGDTSNIFNNAIKYVSPSFGGFSVEGYAALGEGTGPRILEVAGSYNGGPLKAALTYHQAEDKALGLKDKLASAGVSYGFGGFTGRLGYAYANDALSGTGNPGFPKVSSFDVGVDFTTGPFGVSADYVTRDLKSSGDDSHFIRLLGTYNFSKRTQLNANLVYLKNKGDAAQTFYTIDGAGKSQTVIGAGLSHFF